MESTDLETIYGKCYDGYQKVDDIRFALLKFFPLSSGFAILSSLYIVNKNNQPVLISNHFELGLFGLVVSIGLLLYELKGIEKCTQFIFLGAWIETKMKNNLIDIEIEDNKISYPTGYFIQLLNGSSIITEPLASALVYSIVLAVWTYVMALGSSYCYTMPVVTFAVAFISVILYWKFQCVSKNDKRFNILNIITSPQKNPGKKLN